MNRTLIGLGIVGATALGGLHFGASAAEAQLPSQTTVYETVVPGAPTVTYGERYKVRRRLFKTVIRERPYAIVTPGAPMVRETMVVRPAPVVESVVVQPAPIVERRIVQPAPVIESRVIQSSPVIQTRYYAPYPY